MSGPGGISLFDRFWTEIELENGDVLTTCQAGLREGAGGWTCDLANGRIGIDLKLERCPADPARRRSPVSPLPPPIPAGVLVSARIGNRSGEPLKVRQVRLVRADIGGRGMAPPEEWRILRSGYAQGGAHREDQDPRMSSLVSLAGERASARSWGQAAVRLRGAAEGFVIGFVTFGSQMAWIDFDRDRGEMAVAATCETEGHEIPAGGSIETEVLYLGWHDDLGEGLREYAGLCGRRMGVRLKDVPAGWSSAHALAGDGLREEAVVRQADFLAGRGSSLALKVIQVDDGYASAYGDWLDPSGRFPHGLEWLAGRIRERGREAGLWVAPFVVHASSRLFREHPEWMVRDREGRPLGWEADGAGPAEPRYALDGSNPEVRRWLKQLFSTLRRFGFTYFKLDLLFLGCLKGMRHRPVTRVEAFREGLAAIRSGARDAYLLGCGGPGPAAVGLVDGSRPGHDVTAEGLPAGFREAARETHQMFWAHRTLWNTDHDAVVVREMDGISPETSRALAVSVALSGGAVFSGDSLPDLAADRLAILAEVAGGGTARDADSRRRAAVALDLLESEHPRLLARPLGRGKFRLGVFNHSGEARAMVVDFKRLGLTRAVVRRAPGGDSAVLGRTRGRFVTPPVPPHGCIEFVVEPA